jgi:hypothetical protein
MAQQQSYISVDSVIADYLTETEQSNHKYFKIFNLAFRGMDELGLDFFYQIKTVKIPINSNLTATLPSDYLNWTKVGVLNGMGEVVPLYYNERLSTFADLLPARLNRTQDNSSFLNWDSWGLNTWVNYWNGYTYMNVYGVPSGSPFVGSFKIDAANGVMLLNENFAFAYVILEYVSSPQIGEEYFVPVQFREALIAWVAWKDAANIPSRSHFNLGDKRDKRAEFYNERRKAIARYAPIRRQEIYQASQEQTRLAVRS